MVRKWSAVRFREWAPESSNLTRNLLLGTKLYPNIIDTTRRHLLSTKQKATKLREEGYSLGEISRRLKVAKSTLSIWVRNLVLNEVAKKILAVKNTKGLYRANMAVKTNRSNKRSEILKLVEKELGQIKYSKSVGKLLCAFLFWAEGEKVLGNVNFCNSDPGMVALFITLLRSCFDITESKFRVVLQLHEYHNIEQVKHFWSKTTGISLSQFNKVYVKPHTGIRKKVDYKGCASLRYYDWKIAYELQALYNSFVKLVLN